MMTFSLTDLDNRGYRGIESVLDDKIRQDKIIDNRQ